MLRQVVANYAKALISKITKLLNLPNLAIINTSSPYLLLIPSYIRCPSTPHYSYPITENYSTAITSF